MFVTHLPSALTACTGSLVQPEMQLPLAEGDVWFLTGGRLGLGNRLSLGSLDFGPPGRETGLWLFEKPTPVTAAAGWFGVRSGNGAVVLDLDGWFGTNRLDAALYAHCTEAGKGWECGKSGDFIGYPSCEGGVQMAHTSTSRGA